MPPTVDIFTMLLRFLLLLFLCSIRLWAQCFTDALLHDLEVVEYWDRRLNDRLPVLYNNLLQGGYWAMPSARMGNEGEISFGYVHAPPYRLWNLRCQLTSHVELSGNYRIFHGVKDPVLTPYGFGDFSDKGANLKVALFHPEDSDYQLPGVAIGFEDVMGTRAFKARYLVLTQVFLEKNLEISLGYGEQRIRHFFGGVHWQPFRQYASHPFKSFAFSAEYDATPYKNCHIEPHPKGRKQRIPFNFGIKGRFWNYFDLSFSYMRGDAWCGSVSAFYNFGSTKGFFPKIHDPLVYTAPVNTEPLGCLRPPNVLATDLIYAYRQQNFDILEQWLSVDEQGEKTLRLRIVNDTYRLECDVRRRLNNLVARLTPADIDQVVVAIDCEGVEIQEYHYNMPFVRRYAEDKMSGYELKILSPLCEASAPDECSDWLLFKKSRPRFCPVLLPKSYTYFGSARGKFKYALGVSAGASGYLWHNVYYSVALGYIVFQNIAHVGDVDRLNPSQLINVRTDIIRYYQQKGVTLDEAYLQKVWNLGKGLYARLAAGYFEVEYGGVAGELLYYPLHQHWAVGLEGAIAGKRAVGTFGSFTGRIRKFHGFKPSYQKFIGSQYFFNVYYEWKKAALDLRIKIGKFLANDFGVRYEVSRYFPSGLRVTVWYTRTNGRDQINGKRYYDKGIAFSLPVDLFYTRCDQGVWRNGLSAWLRDVGVTAYTGADLYNLIHDHREGL